MVTGVVVATGVVVLIFVVVLVANNVVVDTGAVDFVVVAIIVGLWGAIALCAWVFGMLLV